ncbi:MAG TPA: glycosyltransferase family 39 protein, partial [Chthonomonadaceae bacterium]|nr:glycosyltransferase family 39 protein [Chthonomonadaceae bacterium]
AFQLYHIRHVTGLMDVGFQAESAARIAHGQAPYRDFFSLIPPLHFFGLAILVRLFGPSLIAINCAAAFVGGTICLLVYLICRRFTGVFISTLAFVTAQVFSLALTGTVPSYAFTALMFALASIYCGLIGIQEPKRGPFLLCGLFAGMALWSKQTIGAYVLVGMAPILLARSVRKVSIPNIAAGFLLITVPMLAYLLLMGAWPAFVQDTILYPAASFRRAAGIPTPSLTAVGIKFHSLPADLYWLSVLGLLAALIWIGMHWRERDLKFVYLTFSALCMFCVTHERFGFLKLRVGLPLVVIVLLVLAARCLTGRRQALLLVALVPIWLATILYTGRLYRDKDVSPDTRWVAAQPESIYMEALQVRTLETCIAFLRAHPTSRTLIVPYLPAAYFYADSLPPSRYDLMIPANLPPGSHQEIARDIARADYVLYVPSSDFDGVPLAKYDPRIFHDLETRGDVQSAPPATGVIVLGRSGVTSATLSPR